MSRQKIKIILCMVILGCALWPNLVWAKVPENIRVGLETVYKDQNRVTLHTEYTMNIGKWSDGGFIPEGEIMTSSLHIEPATERYYAYEMIYFSYNEAQNSLSQFDEYAVIGHDENGNYRIYTTEPLERTYPVTLQASAIKVFDDFNRLILVSQNSTYPIAFQGSYNDYPFPLTGVGNSRKYRGAVEVVKGQSKGLTAVSVVPMEDYLYSVVGAEMVASWNEEALKAQAVASRGIATFQYNRYISRGYNVVDSTYTQVYKGINSEHPRTIAAVEATRGEIVTYNGKVAETLYYSTSGGHTEDPVYVWGNTVPYLKALPDPYETEPEMKPWTRVITVQEIEACLAKQNVFIGNVEKVSIEARTSSGRVSQLTIYGSQGKHTLKNEKVRTFFSGSNEGSLRSTMFQFEPYGDTDFIEGTNEMIYVLSDKGIETVDLSQSYLWDEYGPSMVGSDLVAQTESGTERLKQNTQSGSRPVNETLYGDLILYGRGFGHGVGMSQSGAKGMANAGFTYDEIIQYYYPGITIER